MVASSSGSMATSGGDGVGIDVAERQGEGPFGDRCAIRRTRVRTAAGAAGRRRAVLVGHDERREAAQAAEEGSDGLGPLGVDEGQLGPGVLQSVAQLLARPPGVERDDDGAGQGDGPERHDPFGQVAHGDGDPVALRDRRTRRCSRWASVQAIR